MKKQVLFLISLVLISCMGISQEKKSKDDKSYLVEKTDQEWKEELPKMSYMVLRKAATEYPFTGKYNNNKVKGVYSCAGCNTLLYKSENKYDSKCGWPSFDRAVESNIEYDVDYKLGYERTELKCNKCGGHLGHVFNDGPKETTGKRHCINSAALNFSAHE
jgi:peptide-methionine (R)-S-oxide reductase